MSRLKNFSRNIATSYLQLGVNAIYSLVSIPLILHWLPKAEFGLWAVLTQMMAYVSLIDLGLTSAVARLLVDYKDRRSDGSYGSLVKTAFLVSSTQGFIILAAVTAGAPILAEVMKIPVEYRATFIALVRIQGVFTAFNFCLRPQGLLLYAHQRMDIQSASDMLSLVAQLGLLLMFLMHNCGIFSFIYANAATLLFSPFFLFWQCRRLKLLPQTGEWGSASWKMFKDLFNYGKDVFLMALGSQMEMASQTIVVSRALGLETAAIWSVGTKMFNLIVPLMGRPFGAALPGLYEMGARGETERVRKRFHNIVVLTASLGAFLAVAFALCNSLFVQVWTAGKIAWSPWNDFLLALWLCILSMTTTHINLVTVTKQIGGMRYIMFFQGGAFVLLAMFVGCRWGIPGMIITSIICTSTFSYQYSLRRSAKHFHCNVMELATGWPRPCLKLALTFGTFAGIVWLLTSGLPAWWRLAIHAVLALGIGGILFVRVGFPPEMIREAGTRLPRPAAKVLQLLTTGAPS
jgi:O-antigen/teichoic acid export membrane protein